MEKMEKESFIFYRSYAEALEGLSDKDKLSLLEAIIKKSLDNEDIELKGIQKNLFALIKPQIEAKNKRYADGMKGGRPKKTTGFEDKKTTGFEDNENKKPLVLKNDDEKKTKTKPNENVNENVNENEKEKNQKKEINFIDYQFVEQEYKKGKFTFNLVDFWNFWKDKGLKKEDLTNKLIYWDIKEREREKEKKSQEKSKNDNLYGPFKFL